MKNDIFYFYKIMMSESNQIITLITYFDPMKAQVMRTRLASEDIPCFISDGNVFPTHSFFSNEGGIQIKVNAKDLVRAQKVIQSNPMQSAERGT